ncbi:MAG: anaerobic ribonucleoside-triphosphate reductase activating protein [Oscillospiraceae bacterium]|nr:anaerobic ribonucleoside-triphosphate reductase activating protein [Oscillospiraceae bacterium]
MKIQGLAKLTLLDFPGRVACTVFFGGCNLRCPFCHNAGLVLSPAQYDQIDEEALYSFLKKRKGVLDGVAITGGEPLLQPELARMMRRIRELGYAVKLDTNGTFPERLGALLAEGLVDYVAMDIKNDEAHYAETAGVPVDLDAVKASIRLIQEKAPDYEFRTTVVSAFHTCDSIRGAAELIRGAKRYFLQKFVDSGALLKPGLTGCTREEMEKMAEKAREIIPDTQLRGV